jgi:hypothetical protein
VVVGRIKSVLHALSDYYEVALKRWLSLVVVMTGIPGVLGSFGLNVGLPNWGWGLIALGCLAIIQYQAWQKATRRAEVAEARTLSAARPNGAFNAAGTLSMLHVIDPASTRRMLHFTSGIKRRVENTSGRPRAIQFIKPMGDALDLAKLPAHISFPGGEIVVRGITADGIDVEPFGSIDAELIAEVFVEPK